jgi:RND family efflux transporter MFP subunit
VKQAEQAVVAARAQVKTARALEKEASASVGRASADLKYRQLQLNRIKDLVKRTILDKQNQEEIEKQFETAQATVEEVNARVLSTAATVEENLAKQKKAEADKIAAEAFETVARARHAQVKALWDYTRITAPFDGLVTWRKVDPGDLLQPGKGKGGKNEPIFMVARNNKVRIAVDVPETVAPWIALKTPATIRLRGLLRTYFGEVTRTSWAVDPQARTLRVEIDKDNPKDKLHPRGIFKPGSYASVTLTLTHKKVWTVPAFTVVIKDDQPYCFLLEKGKAIRTLLEIGLSNGKRTEVLRKQLRPARGEKGWANFTGEEAIIVTNPSSLVDGQPVKN